MWWKGGLYYFQLALMTYSHGLTKFNKLTTNHPFKVLVH